MDHVSIPPGRTHLLTEWLYSYLLEGIQKFAARFIILLRIDDELCDSLESEGRSVLIPAVTFRKRPDTEG